MFNPIWPVPDKSVDASSEFANTVGNVQTVLGIALIGPGMGLTTAGGLSATASVVNGVDDFSANFTKDNKTLIEKLLGIQVGRGVKGGLSGFGVWGSMQSLSKEGFNFSQFKM